MNDFNIIKFEDYKSLSRHFKEISDVYKYMLSLYNECLFIDNSIVSKDGRTLPSYLRYDECLQELKKEELMLTRNSNLSVKNQKYFLRLNEKKKRFLKKLHNEVETLHHSDSLSQKVTWIILYLNSLTTWDSFVSVLLKTEIEKPKNTRPTKGYKPHKVSSKIIFNRNGKK